MTKTPDIDTAAPAAVSEPRKSRKNNPEKTRENILKEAIVEFVEQGLSGARVDAIAERTHTSKRMIYYYFTSKEQLYVEVLEKLYSEIRTTESQLHLNELEPVQAIRRLVEFTFDHHDRNADFVRIVSIENIHKGEYIKHSECIKAMNDNIVHVLEDILQRGVEQKVFRPSLNPLDVHLLVSSFCYYRVSNRYTVGESFQVDLSDPQVKQRQREMICDSVLRYLQA